MLSGTDTWNRNTLFSNYTPQKSGTYAWNSSGTEMFSNYSAHVNSLNGSMELGIEVWYRTGTEMQCHGLNRRMEQIWNGNMLSGTDAWNRAGTEKRRLEQLHGTLINFLRVRLND